MKPKHYDNYDYEEVYQKDLQADLERKARKEYELENPLVSEDYEEQWKRQQESLQEWEIEKILKTGKIKSLYRTTTTKSENTDSGKVLLEAQIYPSFTDRSDVPRTKKKRESKPSQKNLNDRNSRRYLVELACINFGDGDIWATFGWDDDHMPKDLDAAKI